MEQENTTSQPGPQDPQPSSPPEPPPPAPDTARATAELDAALAAAREQAQARSASISELEADAARAREEVRTRTADIEALKAQVRSAREEYARAVAALVSMHRAANPDIPPELITGGTMAEVIESVNRARDLVRKVRELAEREAGAARVPAGAPGRQPPDADGLSPRDKIALGVGRSRKG
jgi:hypothetical protein